jgi:GTP-binding protein HflX
MTQEVAQKSKRAIVAAVQLSGVNDLEFDASLAELRQLAKTLGFEVVGAFTQKRARFDSAAYFGLGKREELRLLQEECSADVILVDHEISPSQAHNLEKEVGCEVMDRTMVILEIFHRHARSRAARAQVEIARLGYMAPRLREAAKLAGPQGRQRSGVGGRSGGESDRELDRRKIRDRIAELQKELDAMVLERKTQRARRQERQGLARVALVGYTNAGKSTLMRALTGSEALVADKLFATLDTTVRALHPETVPRVLVSDTVGFIKNLPHGLVASFKSTLDEALEASLLVHVVDASDPGFERQLAVTEEVLDEIGAEAVPRLLVFNKIDRTGDEPGQREREAALRAQFPACIVMSAHREGDIAKLHEAIAAFFQRDLVEAELFLPWAAQKMRGEVFATCKVLEEHADGDGVFLRILGEPEAVKRLYEQFGRASDNRRGTGDA